MKMGKKQLVLLVVMALVLSLLAINGCKKAADETETAPVTSAVDSAVKSTIDAGQAAAATEICSACGQIKGSDLCCKPGQEICPKCNLVKGSPGCCKMPK